MFQLWDDSGFNPRSSVPGLQGWWSADNGVYSDGAAHFTAASSQSLSIATNASVAFGNVDFWVAGSFYMDAKGVVRGFITKDNPSGTRGPYLLDYDSVQDRFAFAIFTGTVAKVAYANTFGSPSINTWYQLLGWHDSVNDTVNICVNGGATDSTATGGGTPDATASDFCIGSFHNKALPHDGRADSCAIGTVSGIAGVIAAMKTSLYNSGAGKVYADLTTAEKTAWGLTSWWDLNEETGTRYDAHGTNHLTASTTALISGATLNGNFETAGAGGADVFGSWTETVAGTATVEDEGTITHGGSHAAKLTSDGTNAPKLSQSLLVQGDRYSYSAWVRSASGTPTFRFSSNGGTSLAKDIVVSTTYTQYSGSFVHTESDARFFLLAMPSSTIAIYADDVTLTDLGPVGIAGIAAGVATDGNFCANFVATSSQSLSIANNASVQVGGNDFSVSLDLYVSNFDIQSFISKRDGAASGEFTYYLLANGTLQCYIFAGGSYQPVTSTDTLTLNAFNNITITHTVATKTLAIIINNGTPKTGTYTGSFVASTDTLRIGAEGIGGFCTCRIDSVGLWNGHVLTPTEITARFNHGKGLKYEGVVAAGIAAPSAYWDTDKKQGITYDSTGNGNTLTNNNAVTYAQGVDYYEGVVSKVLDRSGNGRHLIQTTNSKRPAFVTNKQNGKPGWLHDAVDDVLTNATAFSSFITASAHTIFIAFTPIAIGTNSASPFANDNLLTDNAGFVAIALKSTTPAVQSYNWDGDADTSSKAITLGSASIVMMRHAGGNLYLSVNNGSEGSVASGDTTTLTGTLIIGSNYPASAFYNGYIHEIIIYNTALTAGQIAQMYAYLNSKYAVY